MPLAAGETVAKVGETEYTSLKDAIEEADGKTVELTADTELTEAIAVNKNVTLDLKGFTVSGKMSNGTFLLGVKSNGSLTICDTSEGAAGEIISGINVWYAVLSNGMLKLESGALEATHPNGTGLTISGENASFSMTGGSVTGTDEGIRVTNKAKAEISGGKVTLQSSIIIRRPSISREVL